MPFAPQPSIEPDRSSSKQSKKGPWLFKGMRLRALCVAIGVAVGAGLWVSSWNERHEHRDDADSSSRPIGAVQNMGDPSAQPAQNARTAQTVQVDAHRYDVEVAHFDDEPGAGRQVRAGVSKFVGVLFVDEHPRIRCFPSRNNSVPMGVAFVSDEGRVIDVVDVDELDAEEQCSKVPVRFALNAPVDWLTENKVTVGSRVKVKRAESEHLAQERIGAAAPEIPGSAS